jgi:hypothetical protein
MQERLGTRSGVGRGRRQDRQTRQESAEPDRKQRRRARGFAKAQIAALAFIGLSAHPVLDRGCPHRCRDRPFGAAAAANQGDPPWAINFHRQQCGLMPRSGQTPLYDLARVSYRCNASAPQPSRTESVGLTGFEIAFPRAGGCPRAARSRRNLRDYHVERKAHGGDDGRVRVIITRPRPCSALRRLCVAPRRLAVALWAAFGQGRTPVNRGVFRRRRKGNQFLRAPAPLLASLNPHRMRR